MNKIENDIRTFMKAAGQTSPQYPSIPDEKIIILRAKLILEEALEQVDALGVKVTFLDSGDTEYKFVKDPDLTKIADGVADQIYVSVGTTIAFGIKMEKIWELVQKANMDKFGPGSYKREDGKVMKPPGWQPPDAKIQEEIKTQISDYQEFYHDWCSQAYCEGSD